MLFLTQNRNKMNYLNFQNTFQPFLVFSKNDIKKVYPNFISRRLVEWQQKNHLTKIRNAYYCFTNYPKSEHFLYLIANQIYKPSYISLEAALSFYNIIPEGVYTITSISTLKTKIFQSEVGTFSYRNIKPTYFYGYHILPYKNRVILMADLEKAILDYLYLNSKVQKIEDFEGLRWNQWILQETLNWDKFDRYLKLFESKALNKRVKSFKLYTSIKS